MAYTEKLNNLKEKLVDTISKALDKKHLKSKEIANYAKIIDNLAHSEDYSTILMKGLNGCFVSNKTAELKDDNVN